MRSMSRPGRSRCVAGERGQSGQHGPQHLWTVFFAALPDVSVTMETW
jgi:hypothetical protein